ncbi:MAG: dUTPase [Colwellia sp.]|jgi:dUTPase
MKKLLSAVIFFTSSLFIGSSAFANDITQERGYVDFANLDSEYGEPKVMVNLNKTMLGFISKMNMSDPEASELISKLKAVRIQVYNMTDNDQPALDLIAKVSEDIKTKDWLPIVSVNEKDEKVRVFTKITDDIMDGLVVMVINNSEERKEREAVFINIVGEIDPAQINKVTESLNIDVDLK